MTRASAAEIGASVADWAAATGASVADLATATGALVADLATATGAMATAPEDLSACVSARQAVVSVVLLTMFASPVMFRRCLQGRARLQE